MSERPCWVLIFAVLSLGFSCVQKRVIDRVGVRAAACDLESSWPIEYHLWRSTVVTEATKKVTEATNHRSDDVPRSPHVMPKFPSCQCHNGALILTSKAEVQVEVGSSVVYVEHPVGEAYGGTVVDIQVQIQSVGAAFKAVGAAFKAVGAAFKAVGAAFKATPSKCVGVKPKKQIQKTMWVCRRHHLAGALMRVQRVIALNTSRERMGWLLK